VEVRRATYDEAKRIGEFDVFAGDRRVDNWRGELLVCVEGSTVLGFVTYSPNLFYNRPFIGLLCVREGHRRRGAAAALVRRVLEIYDGLDVWASTEEGNEPALRLFSKLGFERKGRIEGLDDEKSVELFFRRPARRAVGSQKGTGAEP
jgi:ribosomal protein S18 acetylase RimI-like enzyme